MNNNEIDLNVRGNSSLQGISEIKKLEDPLHEQQLSQQKVISEIIIHAKKEEHIRIGHELLDNVNQVLSTAQLYLSSLDPLKDNFTEIKKKSLETILLGMEEIRILSREMVIPSLQGDRLIAGIHDIINDLSCSNKFNIVFSYSKPCDIESISKNKKTTLYRIIQEQVRNIVKHSNAKNVRITLEHVRCQLRLSVVDDGIGFDSNNTGKGPGLSNMYERTRLENGKIILTTSPGHGCSLLVNIPDNDKHIFCQSADGCR
jgi:two-component system sensor histidine kinase UhpB